MIRLLNQVLPFVLMAAIMGLSGCATRQASTGEDIPPIKTAILQVASDFRGLDGAELERLVLPCLTGKSGKLKPGCLQQWVWSSHYPRMIYEPEIRNIDSMAALRASQPTEWLRRRSEKRMIMQVMYVVRDQIHPLGYRPILEGKRGVLLADIRDDSQIDVRIPIWPVQNVSQELKGYWYFAEFRGDQIKLTQKAFDLAGKYPWPSLYVDTFLVASGGCNYKVERLHVITRMTAQIDPSSSDYTGNKLRLNDCATADELKELERPIGSFFNWPFATGVTDISGMEYLVLEDGTLRIYDDQKLLAILFRNERKARNSVIITPVDAGARD